MDERVEKERGNLSVSQSAHQTLPVSLSPSLFYALSPPRQEENKDRQKKSNLTFCSCIGSSRLVSEVALPIL